MAMATAMALRAETAAAEAEGEGNSKKPEETGNAPPMPDIEKPDKDLLEEMIKKDRETKAAVDGILRDELRATGLDRPVHEVPVTPKTEFTGKPKHFGAFIRHGEHLT